MKIVTKISVIVALMTAGISTVNASEMDGKQLFESKCMACHTMSKVDAPIAPPAKGIMFHMSEAFDTKDAVKAHINDFVLEPTAEKAICKSVRRFGLMPSLKGAVTPEELEKISEYMINNLSMTKGQHDKMGKGNKGKKRGKNCEGGNCQKKGKGQGKGKKCNN